MKYLIILLLAFPLAQAQVAVPLPEASNLLLEAQPERGQVVSFLGLLEAHPALQAARLSFSAAQARLGAATSPVSVNVSGGVNTLDRDVLALIPEIPGVLEFPTTTGQLSTDVTFRPLVFGDVADLVSQRELDAEGALLDYRETLTSLEARALEAALGVRLAEESLELARRGVELAETALEVTRRRLARGAATERALRDAQAGVQEAQTFAGRAEADLNLARLTLVGLVGEARLPPGSDLLKPLLDLPLVGGVPLEVQRARLELALAQVNARNVSRNLYPTVQAGYTQNLDDRSSLSLSLDSRTLQPSLGYDYVDPGRGLLQSTVRGTFSVGFSLDLSPGTYRAVDAAQTLVEAARAGLQAAEGGAALQREGLENALSQAQRDLALREARFGNAQQDFEEARRREDLGLSTSLETLGALVDLLEADVDLRSARQRVLVSLLDLYEFYALPVSQVLEP